MTSTNGSLSEAFKEATLHHVPFSTCQNAFNQNLANNIVCTTTGSGTSCHGDSGSAVTNLRNGRYFIDGVVSFGPPNCEDDPSGNAEVFDNLGFINQFL
ncbi:hypothetical protein TCAL_08680 [Tigriopus californicus]|uniref:Peptidase S1 domain-containing protein n=1 Tax=Tigriopus californicus TaxID=6832 RepID=A0A553PAA5_TIGCA|nr:elastase-1-like [Tigriopus californicus]TRY74617.1 hypothetical protein TCAL_08680 [Tigriopus californicus]|eukprot:TCALIF_08680-PA protein Name:"Similar to CELA1 Chymotrypsin-like elastase family member 1 (Felis catus)" AED:0.04 eAED:0.04 QI:323/1/0.5/1/0/0.5/2/0/98